MVCPHMAFPSLLLVPFVTLSSKEVAYEVGKKKKDEAWLPLTGRHCCSCLSGYILDLSLSELLSQQTSNWVISDGSILLAHQITEFSGFLGAFCLCSYSQLLKHQCPWHFVAYDYITPISGLFFTRSNPLWTSGCLDDLL